MPVQSITAQSGLANGWSHLCPKQRFREQRASTQTTCCLHMLLVTWGLKSMVCIAQSLQLSLLTAVV